MPKLSINQTFAGYSTAKRARNTPFNFLTNHDRVSNKNTINCFTHNGAVKGRAKFSTYDGMTAKAHPILALAPYKNIGSGNDKIRILSHYQDATNTSAFEVLKFDSAGTPSQVSLDTAISSIYPVKSEFFQNVLYLSYGVATPNKYFIDGTTDYYEPQGIITPSAAPTSVTYTSSGGSGGFEAVSGSTRYQYSYVYKVGSDYEWEGNFGSDSGVVTSDDATGKVTMTLTQPPNDATGSHLTHFRIYRRHPSQSIYYFVEDVAISGYGSTQSYTDDDGTVYDETEPAGEVNEFGNIFRANTQLASAHYGIRLHKGRMWYLLTDNVTLQYSEASLPESCPTRNQFTVGTSADPFTEIISAKGALYIVKKFSIWKLTGETIQDFELLQVADFGSYLPNMTFTYNGFLYGANGAGIWRWTGDGPAEYISRQIYEDWNDAVITLESGLACPIYQKLKLLTNAIDAKLLYSYFHWAVDPDTGYLLFDCGSDSDSDYTMLGMFAYDSLNNVFTGLFGFAHTAMTNLNVYNSDGFVICAEYVTTDEWKYSVYNKNSQVFSSDWVDQDLDVVRFTLGGLHLDELKKIKINYIGVYFNATGSFDAYYTDALATSMTQFVTSQTITPGALEFYKAGYSGNGGCITFERSDASQFGELSSYAVDFEEVDQW